MSSKDWVSPVELKILGYMELQRRLELFETQNSQSDELWYTKQKLQAIVDSLEIKELPASEPDSDGGTTDGN